VTASINCSSIIVVIVIVELSILTNYSHLTNSQCDLNIISFADTNARLATKILLVFKGEEINNYVKAE